MIDREWQTSRGHDRDDPNGGESQFDREFRDRRERYYSGTHFERDRNFDQGRDDRGFGDKFSGDRHENERRYNARHDDDRYRYGRGHDERHHDDRQHDDRHGPGVIDKVKNWWDRNVANPEETHAHSERRHFDQQNHDRWDNRAHPHRERNENLRTEDWRTNAYSGGWGSQMFGAPVGDANEGVGRYGTRISRDSNLASGTPYETGGRGVEWNRPGAAAKPASSASPNATGSGRYVGRGPKGWSRSDERIREDVNEELTRHPDVDASDIEVAVVKGEVTLTGDVDGRHEKREAEDCAWRVNGVRDVHNHLRVKQGVSSRIADAFRDDRR